MRIVLSGVRGTTPVTHPEFMNYGGATTCLLVEDGRHTRVVIDAGTGLQQLLPRLAHSDADHPVTMLFTHYHLDHLCGLPAFAPLYQADWHIHFAAPLREAMTAEMAISRLLAPPFWPVPFRAQQNFCTLPEASDRTPVSIGSFELRWCRVHHRNGCHAYRLDEPASGASVVFATDLEWQASDADERAELLRLCSEPHRAELLIMDGQFDSTETASFSGWGHSAWQDAVTVAQAAGVKRLIVTHHAPGSNDTCLARREQALQKCLPDASLAYEGMEIEIGKTL